MIITKLIGGLGNQMFQYAAGRRLAVVNNTQLKLDITGYDHQVGITRREYMLHIFNIEGQFVKKKEINAFTKSAPFLSRFFTHSATSYIKEKHFHFDSVILQVSDNTYLEGYWASEKYFKDISDVIRKDFVLKSQPDKKNKDLLKRISACHSISVHIRRNDYVHDKKTHDFHGVCELDYYKRAISLIFKRTAKPHFFIFSDDPKWCEANLQLGYPTDYVTHNLGKKDYEDLRLMSACKHHIIANSSFSWWGAWLNRNPEKVVIAPKRWFTDTFINTIDIVPKRWVRL